MSLGYKATAASLMCAVCVAFGQKPQSPLPSLPYTPSLNVQFMDKTADPCVDFYKYACGNWSKLNPMPEDRSSWEVYAKAEDDNERLLWGMLLEAGKGDRARSANEQKIGDYFKACMDERAVEQAGAKPLRPALEEIGRLNSLDDLAAYVGRQHKDGLARDLLFGFSSDQDLDDSSREIAEASAGGLGLPDRDYYTKTDAKSQEIRKRYAEHVATMLGLAGESGADAQAEAKMILAIETTLAQASLTRTEKRNPYNLKHKMTRAEMAKLAPAFNWTAYLQQVGAPAFEKLNVEEPKFFEALGTQLQGRPLAEWRAYLRWHLVNERARFLARAFVNEHFAFYGHYLQGSPQMPPRWKSCTRLVDEQLGEALGQVYVAKTFAPKTKSDAAQMVKEVEAEMERDIKDLNWMSDATKQQALTKLHAVVNKIGYPDRWRDYSSVLVRADDFAANTQNAAAFEEHRQLMKIGQAVDRTEWGMTPPTVNAYYSSQNNDINFPAGVLQPPLFDPKMDAAPNYGDTGATMGHELTHGFDDEGRQFDAGGNLRDWWTQADAKAFEKRVDCVRKQYAQYVIVDDIHINSSLTLGEDVADLGGTLLAYLAWKHATEHDKLEPQDGLKPDQRFFVGMAQWACGEQRPEIKRMYAIINPHSPNEFRVNGVVANMPEFGEAFGCKVGQPMRRENSCRVW